MPLSLSFLLKVMLKEVFCKETNRQTNLVKVGDEEALLESDKEGHRKEKSQVVVVESAKEDIANGGGQETAL